MAKRGRLTKLTPDVTAAILADLATGNTRACAAERAGVTVRSLYRWMAAGKKRGSPFASFLSALKKAERDAVARHVAAVQFAAATTWQAAAWWLERKFPASWGKDAEVIREIVAEYRRRKTAAGRGPGA